MDLQFICRGIRVRIILEDAICILQTNNATGKTLIARLLQEYAREHDMDVRFYASKDYKCFLADISTWKESTIVIIDAFTVWVDKYDAYDSVIQVMQDSKATFIVHTRSCLYTGTPDRTASEYTIVRENKSFMVKRGFDIY